MPIERIIRNYTLIQWAFVIAVGLIEGIKDICNRRIDVYIPLLGALIYSLISISLLNKDYKELLLGMIPGILLIVSSLVFKNSIGLGDGVMSLFMGIILGLERCVSIILSAFIISAVFSLILLILKKVKLKSTIPFVPFLSLAGMLVGVIK